MHTGLFGSALLAVHLLVASVSHLEQIKGTPSAMNLAALRTLAGSSFPPVKRLTRRAPPPAGPRGSSGTHRSSPPRLSRMAFTRLLMYPNGAYTPSRAFHTTSSPSNTHRVLLGLSRARKSRSSALYPRGPKSLLFRVK